MIRRSVLAFAASAALLAQVARADTVTLNNGREIHGRLVEERRESIRMRTEGGEIVIPKAQIASFTEGEVFYNYGGPARPQPQVDADTPSPAAEPGDAARPSRPARPGAPDQRASDDGDWKWPANLSAEKIEELTPIRDRVLEELEALGPTAEERLKALEVSAGERTRIQELIVRFDWQRRQGSANAQRTQARDNVVEFGAKAIPFLVTAVQSQAQWTKRIAAQALGSLAKSPPAPPASAPGAPAPKALTADDMKWLMYHHDVPSLLLALLDHQGEIDSPFVRADGNAALEAMTGRSGGWEASTEPLRTSAESRAREAWETFVKADKARWVAAEKEKEATRAELLKKVELLKDGKNPDDAEPQ